MADETVLALAAHPDDVEFMMAGTLLRLVDKGWEAHYMNIATGSCGTQTEPPEAIEATRRTEAKRACELIGATFHPPLVPDLEVYHTPELVSRVLAVIRRVRPRILLLQPRSDYMEDHMNASRIGVTAAFARGMRNYQSAPAIDPIEDEVTLYHALPYGLRDPMRRLVRAGLYVDIEPVLGRKREMLAAHASQKEWLDVSQGLNAYLDTMERMSADAGRLSGRYAYAEGWRRHLHLGFCGPEDDPLLEALGDCAFVDPAYEEGLGRLE
jgi:LmbE family N-acetylglucosaminyl deacetylase